MGFFDDMEWPFSQHVRFHRRAEKRAASRSRGEDVSSRLLPCIQSPTGVALAAACVSSMVGSIFEAPTEMFKHRTQVSPSCTYITCPFELTFCARLCFFILLWGTSELRNCCVTGGPHTGADADQHVCSAENERDWGSVQRLSGIHPQVTAVRRSRACHLLGAQQTAGAAAEDTPGLQGRPLRSAPPC